MDTKQLSCAERVGAELKDREELVSRLMSEDSDELADLSLGIETIRETIVTLSYGGPADYLHIKHDRGEVLRVAYRFSDWFDTATIDLDESSPLWAYARDIIQFTYFEGM